MNAYPKLAHKIWGQLHDTSAENRPAAYWYAFDILSGRNFYGHRRDTVADGLRLASVAGVAVTEPELQARNEAVANGQREPAPPPPSTAPPEQPADLSSRQKQPVKATPGLKLTDLGNAERLVARHGKDIRHVSKWKKWIVWNGKSWELDETQQIERHAKETVRSMYAHAAKLTKESARAALVDHAKTSEGAARIAAMISLAESEPNIPARVADLDCNSMILPVRNGTIDLELGKLRESRREDMCTRYVDIAWDPAAECPTFLRFLSEITNNCAELVAFLQRAIGYTLSASVKEQVLFFLLGLGSNGKSTLLTVLQALMGDYACQAAPELILAKKGEAHPTEQADLLGKRLAVCTEIGANRSLAENTVKQLTGGDRIKARRMREDFWEFEPTHKFWIAANHKPIIRGTDHAIWRRLLLILFNVRFSDAQKDPDLKDKLLLELPGILKWAVDGCIAWQRDGLQPPAAVVNAVKSYREEQDVIGTWLAERVESAPAGRRVTAKALYEDYAAWCNANGEEAASQRTFGTALTEKGYERVKSGTKKYEGITLKGPRDHADQDPASQPHGAKKRDEPESRSTRSQGPKQGTWSFQA